VRVDHDVTCVYVIVATGPVGRIGVYSVYAIDRRGGRVISSRALASTSKLHSVTLCDSVAPTFTSHLCLGCLLYFLVRFLVWTRLHRLTTGVGDASAVAPVFHPKDGEHGCDHGAATRAG